MTTTATLPDPAALRRRLQAVPTGYYRDPEGGWHRVVGRGLRHGSGEPWVLVQDVGSGVTWVYALDEFQGEVAAGVPRFLAVGSRMEE